VQERIRSLHMKKKSDRQTDSILRRQLLNTSPDVACNAAINSIQILRLTAASVWRAVPIAQASFHAGSFDYSRNYQNSMAEHRGKGAHVCQ
jgi:hypothetical protein